MEEKAIQKILRTYIYELYEPMLFSSNYYDLAIYRNQKKQIERLRTWFLYRVWKAKKDLNKEEVHRRQAVQY